MPLVLRPELREYPDSMVENCGSKLSEMRGDPRLKRMPAWHSIEKALSSTSTLDWQYQWDYKWSMGESCEEGGAWQEHINDPDRIARFQTWLASRKETYIATVSHFGTVNNVLNRGPWTAGKAKKPVHEPNKAAAWPAGGVTKMFNMQNAGWVAVLYTMLSQEEIHASHAAAKARVAEAAPNGALGASPPGGLGALPPEGNASKGGKGRRGCSHGSRHGRNHSRLKRHGNCTHWRHRGQTHMVEANVSSNSKQHGHHHHTRALGAAGPDVGDIHSEDHGHQSHHSHKLGNQSRHRKREHHGRRPRKHQHRHPNLANGSKEHPTPTATPEER